MQLKDVIITNPDEISDLGCKLENQIIHVVDINVNGHFGNISQLEIHGAQWTILSGYNNTDRVGYMIRALVELFDLDTENGLCLRDIKLLPCRIIVDNEGRCIGFGHFMKNKFVLTSDFVKINE